MTHTQETICDIPCRVYQTENAEYILSDSAKQTPTALTNLTDDSKTIFIRVPAHMTDEQAIAWAQDGLENGLFRPVSEQLQSNRPAQSPQRACARHKPLNLWCGIAQKVRNHFGKTQNV